MSNATVIIVREHNGRERRYRAADWDAQSGMLSIRDKPDGNAVAVYNEGAWLSAREDGAELPDATLLKLGYALDALRGIRDAIRAVPHVTGERSPAMSALRDVRALVDNALNAVEMAADE